MHIQHGNGPTEYGPGVEICLTGIDLACAIDAFLVANNINVQGPRTVYVNQELCRSAWIYVDPSGFVGTSEATYHGSGKTDC